jgi:hypothetical protein
MRILTSNARVPGAQTTRRQARGAGPIARDPADIAGQLRLPEGRGQRFPQRPELRHAPVHSLEMARAAAEAAGVEAKRRVRRNEGRER